MKSIVVTMDSEAREEIGMYLEQSGISFRPDITPEWIRENDVVCNRSYYIDVEKERLENILKKTALPPHWVFENREPEYETGIAPFPKKIASIVEEIKNLYMDPADTKTWIVTFSGGKDSTLLSICVWEAIKQVPISMRNKEIIFITSDTGYEMPAMQQYVAKNIHLINEAAKRQQLDSVIKAYLVRPISEHTFGIKVAGKGLPLPTPASPNRWCTDVLKIKPSDAFINDNIEQYGEVLVLTGVRKDESDNRQKSIDEHEKEGIHLSAFSSLKARQEKPGKYTLHPIKDVDQGELWYTLKLFQEGTFPFGIAYQELIQHYEDTGECPMQIEKGMKHCGNSRNGCYFCQMVQKDHMLESQIKKGDQSAYYLNEFRNRYQSILYDAKLRRPFKKPRVKDTQLDAYNPFIEIKEETKDAQNGKKHSLTERKAFAEERKEKQKEFEDTYEPLVWETKPVYPDLELGSHSLAARIFIVKNALYFGEKAGVEIIRKEELPVIKELWKDEFDWVENEEDMKPEPLENLNAVQLKKNYVVNRGKATTIPNFVLSKEHQYKNGKPRILNRTEGEEERFEFYVHRDFGMSEKEIIQLLERAEKKTKATIPFFWNNAWKKTNEKTTFWNVVSFYIAKEDICTHEEACEYVEWYIKQGEETKEMDWSRYFSVL